MLQGPKGTRGTVGQNGPQGAPVSFLPLHNVLYTLHFMYALEILNLCHKKSVGLSPYT